MTAPPRPTVLERLRPLLRVEDVLLSIVGLVVLPLLGGAGVLEAGQLGDAPTPAIGLFALLAILGVLACLLTRGAGEPPPFGAGDLTLQGWARFPLMAGVGVVALDTLPGIGIGGDPFVGITFIVVLASVLAYRWLPVVPVGVRRGLVTPMVLLSAAAFDRIMGSGLGDVLAGAARGDAPPEVGAFLPLIVAASAVLYAMLVIAPRAIADPGASGLAWVVRYVLFLVSVGAGGLLGTALG